jgi:hypothetical protein
VILTMETYGLRLQMLKDYGVKFCYDRD